MKTNEPFRENRMASINALLILLFLLTALIPKAQTPTNFSGKWEYDKAQSSSGTVESNYDGSVIRQITQNPTKITYGDIYIRPGSTEWKTSTVTYDLNGKEKITKHDVGTNKCIAKWSADKKVITITNTDTQSLKGVLQDFLVVDSFKLSENGKTLTIERYSKNSVTGETKAKIVYHKK